MVDDVLEPIPEGGIPEGYVEISEGEFTKVIQLDTPYEIEIVDSLAESGWLLVQIIPVDNKYISKRLVKIITHSNSYDKYNFYNKVKNGTF